jgi:hypothetical protein
MIIEDGTGHGHSARVNEDGQLDALSTMQTKMAYASTNKRIAYIWYSTYTCASGDVVMYIKNTDPDNELMVNTIVAGGVLSNLWKIEKVITAGTVSGAVVTPVNLVLGSGKTPTATAYGNLAVAGISSTTVMGGYYTMGGASAVFDAQGAIVLRASDAICMRAGNSGAIQTFITGFYAPNQT